MDTRFKKGQLSWNKGTKGLTKANVTSFKKGKVAQNKKEPIKKICKCGVVFHVRPSLDRVKCCSRSCGASVPSKKKGIPMSVEQKKKLSDAHSTWKDRNLNKEHWNARLTVNEIVSKHRMRSSQEWKNWRMEVFERDKFTCQECGDSGVYIEPHHIIPIRSDKENLFNTRNGITLCRPCHQKTIWKESDFAEKYTAIVAAH